MDPLISRLAAVQTCFLIVVEPDGSVRHNLRSTLSGIQRNTLRIASKNLLASRTTHEASREAVNWFMEHFDIDHLSIAD